MPSVLFFLGLYSFILVLLQQSSSQSRVFLICERPALQVHLLYTTACVIQFQSTVQFTLTTPVLSFSLFFHITFFTLRKMFEAISVLILLHHYKVPIPDSKILAKVLHTFVEALHTFFSYLYFTDYHAIGFRLDQVHQYFH